jgi:hypothetical protein
MSDAYGEVMTGIVAKTSKS